MTCPPSITHSAHSQRLHSGEQSHDLAIKRQLEVTGLIHFNYLIDLMNVTLNDTDLGLRKWKHANTNGTASLRIR